MYKFIGIYQILILIVNKNRRQGTHLNQMNPAKYLVQTRSVLTIYRDCVKLLHRMVNDPSKALAAQKLLRKEFDKHKQQFDSDKIHSLKMNAVKGISNYLIYTVQRDYKMLNKKPINIMEDEDQLEHLHGTQQNTNEISSQISRNTNESLNIK